MAVGMRRQALGGISGVTAQVPGLNADLSSSSDPFRRKGLLYWTKLQKVPAVCDMVSREWFFLEGKLL